MDTAVKQSNKENSKPKNTESRNVTLKQKLMRPVPLQSKNVPREEPTGDKVRPKTQVKPSNDPNPTQKKTLSQSFRTQQTLRHKKLVLETQKPPSSVPPKPLLPGTYKGRVVQSKIDCSRKPPSEAEKRREEIKPTGQTVFPSKSATVLSRAGVQARVKSRTKSGSDGRVNMQKTGPQRPIQSKAPARTATVSTKPPTVSTKPPTVSTKPPTVSTKPSTVSTKPSTVSTKPPTVSKTTKPSTISRKPVTMSAKPPPVTSFIKKKEPSKPAAAASEQKPLKSITSSISQYRVCVESTEERRLKLAEWLASKGKTLKRPAMTEKSAAQTCRPLPSAAQLSGEAEAEAQPEAVKPIKADQTNVSQSKPAFSNSPSHILNTTLDLLDNSDSEPAELEIEMQSLVVNLCERLEAMETPSSCESADMKAGGSVEPEVKVEEETPVYEILEEEELTAVEKEKIEEEDGEEDKNTITLKAEEEKKPLESDEEEEEEEKMDYTPADVLDACVVKYSVKTTPFLQSVKKRMEGEMVPDTPGSRHKSSIKELKFLTPVRRSSRIHRNSSRLPNMLNEHDPCVSSLSELELLDAADSNAYIYRKNPALLQHRPDQRPEPQSSQ